MRMSSSGLVAWDLELENVGVYEILHIDKPHKMVDSHLFYILAYKKSTTDLRFKEMDGQNDYVIYSLNNTKEGDSQKMLLTLDHLGSY